MYSIMVMTTGVRKPGEGLGEPEQRQQGERKGTGKLGGAPQDAKRGMTALQGPSGAARGGERLGNRKEALDHPRPAR